MSDLSSARVLIFDMDDTLYPEQDFVLSGFRAVASWADAELGIPVAAGLAALNRLFAAGVRGDTFDRWLELYGRRDEGLVLELVRVYRQHSPQIEPFPEVPALLARLGHSHQLGLISDGYLAVQRRKLAALGLAPLFDAVVFSDEWGRAAWKPSPVPFSAALKRLGCRAADAVYIGDNATKDFLGARKTGMMTVWVRRPTGVYGQLSPPTPEHAPDRTIRSLVELESIITNLHEESL